MQEMLKITGIRKSFSTLDVLKGVDLTVDKGEVVARSGLPAPARPPCCAAPTFWTRPRTALIVWTARPTIWAICAAPRCTKPAAHTAFVFQNYNLFLNKTALQNVTEGLIVARKMPRDEAEARA